MKKLTLELGRINKGMRLKLSLILDSKDDPQKKGLELYKNNMYLGNTYIKVNPHPFIVIDISSSFHKSEGWNSNHSVSINLFHKMKFESRLYQVLHNFHSYKNLFIVGSDGKLSVNREVANPLESSFNLGGKTCIMRYVVVIGDDNIEYEGCVFMIESPDNFCYVTYGEIEYLYYLLTHTDLYGTTLQLLSYYETVRGTEEDESDIVELPPILEEAPEHKEHINVIPPIEPPHEIPIMEGGVGTDRYETSV